MRVTLAYPYEGHAPDETIEVPDPVGAQLIHDGLARTPDGEPAGGDTPEHPRGSDEQEGTD